MLIDRFWANLTPYVFPVGLLPGWYCVVWPLHKSLLSESDFNRLKSCCNFWGKRKVDWADGRTCHCSCSSSVLSYGARRGHSKPLLGGCTKYVKEVKTSVSTHLSTNSVVGNYLADVTQSHCPQICWSPTGQVRWSYVQHWHMWLWRIWAVPLQASHQRDCLVQQEMFCLPDWFQLVCTSWFSPNSTQRSLSNCKALFFNPYVVKMGALSVCHWFYLSKVKAQEKVWTRGLQWKENFIFFFCLWGGGGLKIHIS